MSEPLQLKVLIIEDEAPASEKLERYLLKYNVETRIVAGAAERMEIALSRSPPVGELHSKLEATLRRADELVLVNLEHAIEQLDRWKGRFADTDDSDLFGLNEGDLQPIWTERLRECCGRHPPGGPAAGNNDAADRFDHAASAKQKRSMNA